MIALRIRLGQAKKGSSSASAACHRNARPDIGRGKKGERHFPAQRWRPIPLRAIGRKSNGHAFPAEPILDLRRHQESAAERRAAGKFRSRQRNEKSIFEQRADMFRRAAELAAIGEDEDMIAFFVADIREEIEARRGYGRFSRHRADE